MLRVLIGTRQRHSERESHHAATVTRGKSSRVAGPSIVCFLQLLNPLVVQSRRRLACVGPVFVVVTEPYRPTVPGGLINNDEGQVTGLLVVSPPLPPLSQRLWFPGPETPRSA